MCLITCGSVQFCADAEFSVCLRTAMQPSAMTGGSCTPVASDSSSRRMSTAGSAMAMTSRMLRGLKDSRMPRSRANREGRGVAPTAELSAPRGVGAIATIVLGVLAPPGVLLLDVLSQGDLPLPERFAGCALSGSAM